MALSQASYASVQQLQDHAAGTQSTIAGDVARLAQFGIRASDLIDTLTTQTFAPWIATEYIKASSDRVNATRLTLPRAMLELTSITLADSDETSLTVGTDIRGYPRSNDPIAYLQVLDSQYNLTVAANDLDDDLTVVGVWGWHDDYSNAWITSGDAVKTSALTTSSTTVNVTDADGTSGNGYSPRFSAGNLIKIDSEYMAVTATNTDDNTLTVVRAQRGSTAATHDVDATLSVWEVMPTIVRACCLMATFSYDRRGQSSRVSFETVRAGGRNYDIPSEALDILYQYNTIRMAVLTG